MFLKLEWGVDSQIPTFDFGFLLVSWLLLCQKGEEGSIMQI